MSPRFIATDATIMDSCCVAAAAMLQVAKDDVRVTVKPDQHGYDTFTVECFYRGSWQPASSVDEMFESPPGWSIDAFAAHLSRALENALIRASGRAMRSRAQAKADAERETELHNAMALVLSTGTHENQ